MCGACPQLAKLTSHPPAHPLEPDRNLLSFLTEHDLFRKQVPTFGIMLALIAQRRVPAQIVVVCGTTQAHRRWPTRGGLACREKKYGYQHLRHDG